MAENLNKMLPAFEDETIWKDDELDSINDQMDNAYSTSTLSLTRLDILTLIVASSEITVLSDIFKNISKFPIALPIILPNPTVVANTTKLSIVTQALKNCLIKWEVKEKRNGESYLFKNPYKLITAIRVGNSETIGKSSFLNQIFLQSNIFQCKGQPGNGKPYALNGTVEFIWLTKETCKEPIWSVIQAETENCVDNEIVLLANFHGDALQNKDTLHAINSMTSKYIVFVMPNGIADNCMAQLENICGKDNLLLIYVDPNVAVKNVKQLNTHLFYDWNGTVNKLKQYIKQALKTGRTCEEKESNLVEKISAISIKESQEFMDLVNQLNNSVSYAKDLLCLQRVTDGDVDKYWRMYQNSPYLVQLMEKFRKVFNVSLPERRIGLTHVENELVFMSGKKLAGLSGKLTELKLARSRTINSDERQTINEEISKINIAFENELTLNDILRELSIAYEIIKSRGSPEEISYVSKLPALYADLLIEGRTIEILDGNAGSVPGIWLESVCHEVCQKLGDLKIYVVSILGLQSSGKSTLLNALFGCKFATSVGKCTKGLYMRLMLLEESFKKQLGLDAILVVDTEGLGSPESMLDPNAQSKDRTMATFAMTISNLTLINVAGESNKEMVDILQIVILTIARMEKTDLSPDILLVQQVPEGGNDALLSKGVDNFCKALEEAVRTMQRQEIDLGIRTLKNLKVLKQRLEQGEILYPLRQFKSGASPQSPPSEEYCQDIVGLRTRIIDEYRKKKDYINFCTWHKVLKGYWKAVQKENFALRFKSIRQVQEFVEVNVKLASVKTRLDMAFQYHRTHLDDFMDEKLQLLNEQTAGNEKFENQILEHINSEIDLLPTQCPRQTPEETSCQYCMQAEVAENSLKEFISQTTSVSLNDTEANLNANIKELRKVSKIHILRRYESLKIKHGKASECEKMLNKIMKEMKGKSPTVDDVWNKLESAVKKKYPIRFKRERVIDDIAKEYQNMPDIEQWKCNLENMALSSDDSMPILERNKAKKNKSLLHLFTKPDLNLSTNEHIWLCDKFKEITQNIMTKRKEGQGGYAEILVFEHKNGITDVFKKFEKRFQTSLNNQFKQNAIFYSLQLFLQQIILLQNDWDWQFETFYALLNDKQEYLKKIDIYLATQSPMEIQMQGASIAKQLLEAAKSVCMSSLDITQHFEKWATKTEGIRLRYLFSLADELKQGNENVVLANFEEPQRMLVEWYFQSIQGAIKDCVVPMVKDTFLEECAEIGNQIVNTNSMGELTTFVNWYLTKIGKQLPLEKMTEDMQDGLKSEIDSQITKMVSDYSKKITVENLPIKDDAFWNYLGCTASCPGCAAICWGAKNHENSLAIYKRHFTCHQPKGLAGVVNKTTGALEFKSCFEYDSDDGDSLTNSDNMENDDGWFSKKLPDEEYSRLMQWFFLKLRTQLSEILEAEPPSNDSKENNQLIALEGLLDHNLNFILHKSEL